MFSGLLAAGSSTSRRLSWSTPWGTQADFYVDAVADDKRVIAVFSDSDLWDIEQFHPGLDHDFDTRPQLTGYCCGTSFERRGYPLLKLPETLLPEVRGMPL